MGKELSRNTKESTVRGKKNIRIIPFRGKKEEWRMWPGKFMAGAGIKGYHVLITSAKTVTADDEDKTKEK